MKKVLVIAIALTFALTACAFAGANPVGKIAIHAKAHPTSCTKGYPVFVDCNSIVETWAPLGDVDVMPVFYDLTQYTVVETGLLWPEADWYSASWIKCKGDIAVGSITHSVDAGFPQDVSGTAIAWTTCQTGTIVAPGFAWLAPTTAGYVCPVPNPATGDYGTVDCAPEPGPYYDLAYCVGCAGFGGFIGDDPCNLPSATEPSTWGEIKSIFK